MITMHLDDLHYGRILSGDKTVEARVNDEKRQTVKEGDMVIFVSRADPDKRVFALVERVERFKDWPSLLEKITVEQLGFPAGTSKKDLLDVYAKWYLPSEVKKYGVVALTIKID